MRINHNIAALNTYRQLTGANNGQQKAMEKLSSGLRINRAGDDAAGLAISEKMRGQIRGLDQAQSNSQDSISLIQTAEGALNETHSILQRMRELSVQASNDTATSDDRGSIQDEINQLKDEIDRIASTTEFNTKKLLNGDVASNITADGTQVQGVSTTSKTQGGSYVLDVTAQATKATINDAAAMTGALSSGASININGTDINFASGDDLKTVIDKINLRTSDTGVAAMLGDDGGVTLETTKKGSDVTLQVTSAGDATKTDLARIGLTSTATASIISAAGTDAQGTIEGANFTSKGNTITSTGTNSEGLKLSLQEGTATAASATIVLSANATFTNAATLSINGVATLSVSNGLTLNELATNLNNDATLSEFFTATADATNSTITFTSKATGENAKVDLTMSAVIAGEAVTDGTGSSGITISAGGNVDGNVLVDNSNQLTFQIGANEGQDLTMQINNMSSSNLGGSSAADKLDQIDVTTRASAASAITNLDAAIQQVSSERSKLGAIQNRLEHTINNLGTSSENLTAAESRIRDVDMAKEMMNQTKNSILSQAAQAMLAQANQQPQGVLQLLR